ncbi:hypothetical protein JDV02_003007 [Purpureocillium takamizusanense]|uniref:Uncharacterized protein n=1 Tax=Purpureocillium takamizusanense TaxID=2060973 RepID=A0A9Q8V9D9_9HYPO|nr:uncharacterized protein JDV02_003007 [Purpureocillium takamizusanense]UNI16581.1 hypothetical protein JDV02_003007 [Purpureocillium takamizusanense]
MGAGWLNWVTGTQDTILVGLGTSADVILQNPWTFSEATVEINLKTAFGSETVALHEINIVKLFSQQPQFLRFTWPSHAWLFSGLTLTAQCVGSNEKIVMDRYSDQNSPYLKRDRNKGFQEVWRSSEILPKSWHFAGLEAHDEH